MLPIMSCYSRTVCAAMLAQVGTNILKEHTVKFVQTGKVIGYAQAGGS